MNDDDSQNPLAIEIREEMALAYFAACRKMEQALEALAVFDRDGGAPDTAGAVAVKRMELLDRAVERVYGVVIQREAMRLRCAEEFYADYGIPAEVRVRMGVWRPSAR